MSEFWRRLRFLFRRDRLERELEEEMRLHVEMQAEENHANGMAADEARYAAMRSFGNATLLKERSGDAYGWRPLERLYQDLRYAVRTLRRNPTFAVVAVVTLALAIGANTAIFSAMYALLFRTGSFPEPERLVFLHAQHESGKNNGAGYRDFLDWREQSSVFEEMAIIGWRSMYTLTGQREPERLSGRVTTFGFLRVVGVQPALGRFFTEEEDRPGAARVAVLSYPAWQARFGGRADVLGRSITLEESAYTIIGVMPKGFVFPGTPTSEFWAPLRDNPNNDRFQHQYTVAARLKPGISFERAQGDMTAIARRLGEQYPQTNKGWSIRVIPLAQAMAPQVKTGLAIISGVVALVLLLACANLAGLLLARASGRAREIAVRASLGASRMRLIRQMLTESVLLALAGGCLGLLFTAWLMGVMRTAAHPDLAFDAILRLDGTVLAFTLAVSLLTGVVFGLAPAIYASRTDLNAALKGGANAGSGARSRSRLLSALVAGQIALSVVLLAGAALLEKDFLYLLRLDTGVSAENVLTFNLELPRSKYPARQTSPFWAELTDRLRAVPGVQAASTVGSLPMSGNYSGGPFEIEGRPKPADWMRMSTQYNHSNPGYFQAMGIPLLRGRDFDARDVAGSTPVVIINDFIARQYFTNEDPIGRRLRIGSREWGTMVGVVGSVRHAAFSPRPEAQVYFAEAQSSDRAMSVVVRTAGDPSRLSGAVREIVRALDPGLPILKLRTMQDVVLDSLSQHRLMTSFMAMFAAFSLLLAAIGIYGVIAFSVSQRTQEMGVRMALGATYRDVIALVVRKAVLLACVGVVIGVPAALGAGRVMRSLLYGVSPRDLTVFLGVPALLLVVAMAASYIPARRAARVDPLVALRQE